LRNILYFGLPAGMLCLFLLGFLYPSFQIIQTSGAQSNATSDAQSNATSDAQLNATYATYENPKFGLTLKYPSTWSVDELRNDPDAPADDSIVVIFKTEPQEQNDKYLENVIINVQGPRSDIKSLDGYTKNSIQAFRYMSDIKITKSVKDTLAGFPAHQLQYTSKIYTPASQEVLLKKMQVFTVLDHVGYVVTYAAEQAEYDKNIQYAENLINSIKIDRNAI